MANLSVTASQVLLVSGSKSVGAAGAAITAGQTLYLDVSANTLKLAQADGTSEEATFKGIALCDAASGQKIVYAAGVGTVVNLGAGAAAVEATTYVLSATAGSIAVDADISTSTHYKSIVCVGIGSNQVKIAAFNSTGQVA